MSLTKMYIWGMDFGDCHKSIFAHDGSVTQVMFVPNTHHLFTTGRDKVVKYWDADKFEHIQTLQGHQSEVWGLAVNKAGRFIVTVSHDRSIRIWEETSEQLFLEEERENQLDQIFEESLLEDRKIDADDPTVQEQNRPSKVTMESIKGSERIMEALDCMEDPETSIAIALLSNRKPAEYVVSVVSLTFMWLCVKITLTSLKASDIEEALLLLPYGKIVPLLTALDDWILNCPSHQAFEICCRTLYFLLGAHNRQLTTDTNLTLVLLSLNNKIKKTLTNYKRVVGRNRAALAFLQREIEHSGYRPLFEEAERVEEKKKKKKAHKQRKTKK